MGIDENILLEIVIQQGWKFPLNYPLVLNAENVTDWDEFQLWLKTIGYINQGGKCICGKELNGVCDLHHALITRKDCDNFLIHSSYNVVICHRECHPKLNRWLCLAFLVQIFSLHDIQDWYQFVKEQIKSNLRNLSKLEGENNG